MSHSISVTALSHRCMRLSAGGRASDDDKKEKTRCAAPTRMLVQRLFVRCCCWPCIIKGKCARLHTARGVVTWQAGDINQQHREVFERRATTQRCRRRIQSITNYLTVTLAWVGRQSQLLGASSKLACSSCVAALAAIDLDLGRQAGSRQAGRQQVDPRPAAASLSCSRLSLLGLLACTVKAVEVGAA